jgi:hypothetical protein
MSRQDLFEVLLVSDKDVRHMDFQIKLLQLQDRGNYLIALTRGSLNVEGFEQLFRQIKDASLLPHCKILVDLADVVCHLDSVEIDRLVNGLSDFWFGENRVALISPSDVGQYDRLSNLRAGLSNRGFKVGVFVETKAAADWLAER